MSKLMRRKGKFAFSISVGWVFADLLLALAMLFLIANTVAPAKPVVTPTPTPIPPTPVIKPTPTPNALLLDQRRYTLTISNIDPTSLIAKDPGTINDLEGKIKSQIIKLALQNRRAGIAIAYGGTDDNSAGQINQGVAVASEVYSVLDQLGQQKFVFCKTLHYDPLFTLKENSSTIVIDMYMFNKSVGGCDRVS